MPSANITPAVNSDIMDYITQPMKPALTIVEHKIRNLEKRKSKLDQYKSEQDAGKELNADQLAAVSKYGEVIQQLELARDLMKQIGQANDDTKKEIKKQRKAELAERAMQETEKLRTLFLFQLVIKELENGDVGNESSNNTDLKNAVLVIKKHQFVRYSEILKMYDPNVVQSTVDMLASNWIQVLDGSKKLVDSQSKERTTFKNIRDNLLAVANSDYFVNKRNNEAAAAAIVQQQDEIGNNDKDSTISDSESIPSSANNNPNANNNNSIPQELHRIEASSVISAPIVQAPAPMSKVHQNALDSAYQFLQDSQIDLGSPHFDPAVVAVSSSLPSHGPPNPHIDHLQARNAYTVTTPASNQNLAVSMSNGMNNRMGNNVVVADYGRKPILPLIDETITEWNANDAHQSQQNHHQQQNGNHHQQEDRNGGDNDQGNEGGNYNNRFGSNNRGRGGGGGGRNFRGRGSSNGFAHRGNSRGGGGGRPSTGFPSGPGNTNNSRIGYFRSDQQQQQDHSFDSREFRSTSRSVSAGGVSSTQVNIGNSNGSRSAREPGSGSLGRNLRSESGVGGGGYGIGQRQGGRGGGVGISHGQGGGNERNNYGGGGGGYRGGAGARGGNNNKPTRTSESSNGLAVAAKCY